MAHIEKEISPQMGRYHHHCIRFRLRVLVCLFEFIALWLAFAQGAEVSFTLLAHYEIPCLVGAITWNVAEFITLHLNKRGIHPGAHIALDLLLSSTDLFAGLADLFEWIGLLTDTHPVNELPLRQSKVPLGLTLSMMEILAGIMHFLLFILACIAVHKWRKSRVQPGRLEAGNELDDVDKAEISTGKSILSIKEESLSTVSPPPYTVVATELPGETSASRLEYLRAQQARLQEERARLPEVQRIENEEAQIREEIDLLRAREESLRKV